MLAAFTVNGGLKLDRRQLLVLYGSQTGTAQDAAERLGREGKRRHFRVRVSAMDSYNLVSMRSRGVCVYIT